MRLGLKFEFQNVEIFWENFHKNANSETLQKSFLPKPTIRFLNNMSLLSMNQQNRMSEIEIFLKQTG